MEGQVNEIPEQKRPIKRTHQRYSLEEKLLCIERLESGEEAASISKAIGPKVNTIKKWKKDKDRSQESIIAARAIIAIAIKRVDVYSILHNWWETQRLKGSPVTKTDLECQAVYLKVQAGTDAPESVEDILSKFMKQASVEYSPITLKKIPISEISNQVFTDELSKNFHISGLAKCQVFNFADIAWNFKSFPGFKISFSNDDDDYVRILSISNADETIKIPLIITKIPGETKFWKNEYNIPLYSVNNIGQFVDESIINHWFEHAFVPEIKKYFNDHKIQAQALLIFDADKFKSLPKNIDHISCLVSSKNHSYLVSPFDDGLMGLMKQCKKSFLTKLHQLIITQPQINLLEHLANIENGALLLWVVDYWKRGFYDQYREPSILDLYHQIKGFEILTQKDIDDWMVDFKAIDSVEIEQIVAHDLTEKSLDSAAVVAAPAIDTSTFTQAVIGLDAALQLFAKHNLLTSSEIRLLQEGRRRLASITGNHN